MTTAPYPFSARHIGPDVSDVRAMLAVIGVPSVETLISQAVPQSIRLDVPLALPAPASEAEALAELAATMAKNTVLKSFIGAGYHGVHVPPVIQRNLFENPAWYTAYTPYQAEISQGRLEMLFNFQTLVTELTGPPVASASLLDEATAVAEAVGIALRHHRDKRTKVALAGTPHPQTLDVVRTRAEPLGIEIDGETIDDNTAALLVSWPDTFGVYGDHKAAIDKARATGAIVVFIADPLGLTLTDAPAELGADIAVGPMQRFGVPMGFGGPHAAYCAVSDRLTRLMPGRLVRPVGRRQRQARLCADAVDARTAYPPRKGDLQHLHGAGAARQHGDGLCHLARSRRLAGDRRAHPCIGQPSGKRPEGGRRFGARRQPLRHGDGGGEGQGR